MRCGRAAPRPAALLPVVLLAALLPAAARAQISPGELSAPHAELEGSGKCLSCHQARQGVAPDRCLGCHELLRERIAAGRGLHARPGHEACQSCHIEHHGREFDLVWWGEEGQEAFDHRETGYPLEGAHAGLSCRDCHRAGRIRDPGRLREAGKDLDRTFLGLTREGCLDCHRDEHRGQFASGECTQCHGLQDWKPAAGFDHQQTAFALTGRHREVACTECHPREGAEEAGFVRFSGIPFQSCSDCHRDPHQGRLGPACAGCHGTAGWERVERERIDHDRTRFPLAGAHRRVDCAGCHGASSPLRMPRFGRCDDCHQDPHLGQLRTGAGAGACDACHGLERFTPSSFDWRRHAETSYPLEGAHLAVPCDACHRRLTVAEARAEIPALTSPPRGQSEVIRFRWPATACADCHGDPHRGEVARHVEEGGCESCHSLSGWRRVDFDHDGTRFRLEGRHQEVPCAECHRPIEIGTERERLQMAGLPLACAGCHRDPHLGQFSDAEAPACQRCHTVAGWKPSTFDHDREGAFRLEGAHRRLECVSCHPLEKREGRWLVRYRPLPTTCEGCHAPGRQG